MPKNVHKIAKKAKMFVAMLSTCSRTATDSKRYKTQKADSDCNVSLRDSMWLHGLLQRLLASPPWRVCRIRQVNAGHAKRHPRNLDISHDGRQPPLELHALRRHVPVRPPPSPLLPHACVISPGANDQCEACVLHTNTCLVDHWASYKRGRTHNHWIRMDHLD